MSVNEISYKLVYTREAFNREDESDDSLFYMQDRFVDHLDQQALSTVEHVLGSLIVQENPAILDLMAGWNSHLPDFIKTDRIVGLGLNQHELETNPVLTEFVVHDLNKKPELPFQNGTFDVIINTVSVDYIVHPFDIFREAGRILKPGGLFIVIFSNRMFPQKAVKIWRDSSDEERMLLVKDFFNDSGAFSKIETFIKRGQPRPLEDKYAGMLSESDPIFVVYAEKMGKHASTGRKPTIQNQEIPIPDKQKIAGLKKQVKTTFRCPYCNQKLKKWEIPQTPFTAWDNEYMYICFNDTCPYLLRGWNIMDEQGNFGLSYRLQYNPGNDTFSPMPIPSLKAFRESIVE